MTTAVPDPAECEPLKAPGSLDGAQGWLISDGRAGNIAQLRGVAVALGLETREIVVEPTGLFKLLAPYGPVAPAVRFGHPGSDFAPPWPAIALATGRASIPYVRALKRHAGRETFTVVLQDPRSADSTADMIWVPAHDKRRGPNVFTTLTSPHVYAPERIAERRSQLPADILALPFPRVLVSLGGRNKVYRYTEADNARLAAGLRSLADLGVSFMMTASRRSHPELIAAAKAATETSPRIFWEGDGPNPYPDFLAAADVLFVTGDSVNMCGEAAATGRPVIVFHPSGGSDKFDRFHQGLENRGAVRAMPDRFESIPDWSYEPIYSARRIGDEIARRYAIFRARDALPPEGP